MGAARYWYSHFVMRTQVVVILLASVLAAAQPVPWRSVLDQSPAWYGTPEARLVADSVLAWQRASGGWPKDVDMTRRPSSAAAAPSTPDSTIDNGATVTQIRLLDRVFAATRNTHYRDAAIRGLDFLFAAQYPNGGWPQFYPLRDDYSRHITFNDDAMSGVLSLLEDLVGGRVLSSVDEARRARAAAAIDTRDGSDPSRADSRQWSVDRLVRPARRGDARAKTGARLRTRLDQRSRVGGHRPLPDAPSSPAGDRGGG